MVLPNRFDDPPPAIFGAHLCIPFKCSDFFGYAIILERIAELSRIVRFTEAIKPVFIINAFRFSPSSPESAHTRAGQEASQEPGAVRAERQSE